MNSKTIVILGGGTGGLVAANTLRKLVGREHRVILVDRNQEHLFSPSYLWLMLGMRRPDRISKPLARLGRKGIEFRCAEIHTLDLSGRTVKTSGGDLRYDYLVVALGAETAIDAIPGLAEAAYDLYDMHSVQRLRDALRQFHGGRVVVLVSRLPFKCPAAPYEAAMLLESFFAQHGLRNKVDLSVYSPEPQPMPVAGPDLGAAVKGMLEQRGIRYFAKSVVSSVDPQHRQVRFENDDQVSFDLLVAVPPHQNPKVVRESGLAGETGWVPVDPETLQTRFENVWAIGDVTGIKLVNGHDAAQGRGVCPLPGRNSCPQHCSRHPGAAAGAALHRARFLLP